MFWAKFRAHDFGQSSEYWHSGSQALLTDYKHPAFLAALTLFPTSVTFPVQLWPFAQAEPGALEQLEAESSI